MRLARTLLHSHAQHPMGHHLQNTSSEVNIKDPRWDGRALSQTRGPVRLHRFLAPEASEGLNTDSLVGVTFFGWWPVRADLML